MNTKHQTPNNELRTNSGSALILAVVLTSLLAIIGVMFVLLARVDKMATSAIAENKELNLAVDTVIARISGELTADVPGTIDPMDPNLRSEYYDYPDLANRWLASLEPYQFAVNDYRWRQISNITGGNVAWSDWIADTKFLLDLADADGDGVSDSRWIMLPDITSGKGKPVYAAVRVVDNCGMLNVNTGFKFDPTTPNLLDGSSQMQINLAALSQRGANGTLAVAADKLQLWRCGAEPNDIPKYERDVVWQYDRPNGAYTPFDISDELELRNRFLLDHQYIDTRIEDLWNNAFWRPNLWVPVDSGITDWFYRAQHDITGPNDIYSYRHLGTTYNMDRIINPKSERMFDVNRDTDVQRLYEVLRAGDPNVAGDLAAQLAVNIVDFADNDANVTFLDVNGVTYYGFETQPFISEIGIRINRMPERYELNAYAVELYNPFNVPIPLWDANGPIFQLQLISRNTGNVVCDINFPPIPGKQSRVIEAGGCFVIANLPQVFGLPLVADDVMQAPCLNLFHNWIPPSRSTPPSRFCPSPYRGMPPIYVGWDTNASYDLYLRRNVGGRWIYIDRQLLIDPVRYCIWAEVEKYFARDVRPWPNDWRIVYQTLAEAVRGSLGTVPNGVGPSSFAFSFFLPNRRFITVGDIPRVLTRGPGLGRASTVGEQLIGAAGEEAIRLNLRNPYNRNVFQYLTVFDPIKHGHPSTETRVMGRININTAPWYVIAQLPWVTPELARAIVAYRDKLDLEDIGGPDYYRAGAANSRFLATGIGNLRELPGFASIGELNFVIADRSGNNGDFYSVQRFGRDANDLLSFPDLTPLDGIPDDLEERDVIFSRISNLVTVRSDVFTAYILVRIGADGPQKRVVAILDRSGVYPGEGRVEVIAVQPVPDPR